MYNFLLQNHLIWRPPIHLYASNEQNDNHCGFYLLPKPFSTHGWLNGLQMSDFNVDDIQIIRKRMHGSNFVI